MQNAKFLLFLPSTYFAGDCLFFDRFSLVLGAAGMGVALGEEASLLFNMTSESTELSLAVVEQALKVATLLGMFLTTFGITCVVFSAGASLTAASKGVALRAHTLTLQLAMADEAKARENVHAGELFERQVAAEHCPPFQAMGIAITRSLGAKILYCTLSIGMTILFSRLNTYKNVAS